MKKLIVSIFICCYSLLSLAEEGMLIPSLIAAFESDMKAKGMKLTAEQIYSINHSSLKDAVIHFFILFCWINFKVSKDINLFKTLV